MCRVSKRHASMCGPIRWITECIWSCQTNTFTSTPLSKQSLNNVTIASMTMKPTNIAGDAVYSEQPFTLNDWLLDRRLCRCVVFSVSLLFAQTQWQWDSFSNPSVVAFTVLLWAAGTPGGWEEDRDDGVGGNLRPKNNDRKWAQNVLGSVHRPRLPETAAGSQKHTPDHPASNSYWGCGYFCLWCMTNNQRKLTSILLTEKSYQWAIPEGITSGEPGLITQVILSWGLGLDIGTHDSTQIGMSHGRDETHGWMYPLNGQ